MPNNYDFSKLSNVKSIEIQPEGWINPLDIEYGIDRDISPTLHWRVKGTEHTFVIPVLRIDFISTGDYAAHFKETLELFREKDYLSWREQEFVTEWMQEYRDQYKNYIL